MSDEPVSMRAPSAAAPASRQPLWLALLWYWGTVAAWMAVISLLSTDAFSATNTNRYIDPLLRWLFPGWAASDILAAHTAVRKAAHFSEFFVLGGLVFWASRRGRVGQWHGRWMLQSLIIAGGYALLDEAHQAFVPSRTPSLADSGVDFFGAIVSQLAVYRHHRRLRRRGVIG
jgi:VanZ family protein